MNVMPEITNTTDLSTHIIQVIMDDPKVQESADFYARTKLNIPFGPPIGEDQEDMYYALSAEYLMVTLGKVIALISPAI